MLDPHETELVALRAGGDAAEATGSGSEAVGPRAAAVIDEYYEDLRLVHARRVAAVGGRSHGPSSRSRHTAGGGSDFDLESNEGSTPSSSSRSARCNQRDLYLDDERRLAAAAASRRHLEAHKDWLFGPLAFSLAELRARVALQHLASVDTEDLSLPPEQRRADDTFTDEGISHQLLLDAGRSDFVLPCSSELSFRREVEARGVSLEENSLEVERMLRSFEERFVAALLRSLGPSAPRELIQAVSRAMSQSGMANLERACQGPQIVVSGGEQNLRYELTQMSGRAWEVRATLRKFEFEQFVVVGEACLDEPGKVEVMECHPDSQILRSCTVVYEVVPAAAGVGDGSGVALSVDVRGLVDRVELLDRARRPIVLDQCGEDGGSNGSERGAWKAAIGHRVMSLVQFCGAAQRPLRSAAGSLATQAVQRCRFCRRRARGAVDSAVQLPRRMVSGIEDADASMRAPLRD